ncbi:MAG: N-acetylmuramoyl-L-alanine amidase [Schwartzia sp.]|nr:N-acetylmuramoyl-L-alanine amidase [Schwartzia sp. (in: firmicutes)]
MRAIDLDELKKIAEDSAKDLWVDARSEDLDTPKIILHWSAGWWDQPHKDYHINITGDGRIWLNEESLAETLPHTWKLNTGTVGVSLCCCAGATSSHLGENPPTEKQINIMAQVVAVLCEALDMDISEENVLTHGEAADSEELYDEEDLYGPNNDCERWDLQFLGTAESPRFTKDHSDPITGGNVIRGKAIWYAQEAKKAEQKEAAWEKDMEAIQKEMDGAKRYNALAEMPDWAKPTIEKMIAKKLLSGDGKGLDLSHDMLRVFVIHDRAGLYD